MDGSGHNGALFWRKAKKVEGRAQLDASGSCKKISTISGYESDAHAIPLDVLASVSSLFGISTDELLGLKATETLDLTGLTQEQRAVLKDLRMEYLTSKQNKDGFSEEQMRILDEVIKSFY